MITFLRINGAKIEKSTFISISSRIVGSKIYIGKDVRILSGVKIKGRERIIELGINSETITKNYSDLSKSLK